MVGGGVVTTGSVVGTTVGGGCVSGGSVMTAMGPSGLVGVTLGDVSAEVGVIGWSRFVLPPDATAAPTIPPTAMAATAMTT